MFEEVDKETRINALCEALKDHSIWKDPKVAWAWDPSYQTRLSWIKEAIWPRNEKINVQLGRKERYEYICSTLSKEIKEIEEWRCSCYSDVRGLCYYRDKKTNELFCDECVDSSKIDTYMMSYNDEKKEK